MFEVTVSGLRANEKREHVSEEIAKYIRTEFGEREAEWLVAKRENGH